MNCRIRRWLVAAITAVTTGILIWMPTRPGRPHRNRRRLSDRLTSGGRCSRRATTDIA
jgi:hypothetical protein